MHNKLIIALLPLLACFASCKQSPVVKEADVAFAFSPAHTAPRLAAIDTELRFWGARLAIHHDDLAAQSKTASLLCRRFSYSGNVAELHSADSLYRLANQLNHLSSSGTFRSLATNSITLHRFREASAYIDSAMALGDDRQSTLLQKFDVDLELGRYADAKAGLAQFRNDRSFEYLIRLARYKDHAEGKQDEAIQLLEKALARARELGIESLVGWAQSNLGDFYSHAGRVDEAYAAYRAVLARDPNAYHSLKGIAWIAFAHDGNTKLARKILEHLQQVHPVPDYELMLSEVAGAEGKTAEAAARATHFLAWTGQPAYGGMYNKYRFFLLADGGDGAAALRLAKVEVSHRPTPEAYAWLAYGYSKTGQLDSSLYVSHRFVENRCFEPHAYYILANVFKDARDHDRAALYFHRSAEAAFELGPQISARVKANL